MEPLSSSPNLNYLIGIGRNEDTSESISSFRAKPSREVSREKIHYLSGPEHGASLERSTNQMIWNYVHLTEDVEVNPYDEAIVVGTQPIAPPKPKESLQGVLTSSLSTSSSEGEASKIRFKEKLARGGFGAVWLAKMKKLGADEGKMEAPPAKSKKVAVKEFFEVDDRELALVESLIRQKPNGVPRLYGIMHGNHLVMKFCNGGTAATYLNNVEHPRSGFRKLAAILETLDAFHHAGYCHRDVHEGNIMLHRSKNGHETVYLADFGHAAKIKNHEPQIPSIGSRPMYFNNTPIHAYDLHQEGKKTNDYTGYNEYLNQNGKQIDYYQAGMMIFRFATAGNGPIPEGVNNNKQKNLVIFLRKLQEEKSSPFLRAKLRANTRKYLETNHPEIDKNVRKVIVKLLFPSSRTSLKRAGKTLLKESKNI